MFRGSYLLTHFRILRTLEVLLHAKHTARQSVGVRVEGWIVVSVDHPESETVTLTRRKRKGKYEK